MAMATTANSRSPRTALGHRTHELDCAPGGAMAVVMRYVDDTFAPLRLRNRRTLSEPSILKSVFSEADVIDDIGRASFIR
jgi:hypothetical protein